ncbi:succinylglutamate desuccinylase/aspartoacylase family protein [Thalassoroseus pseudoceratinae]|uniref:succinylglutamate desuccinylase/aspartoacylase family protein n=1 Tax=Thalassoroseus pseudoceratinae TaxID=2713176 RepID=UPI001424061E|nr:succinylglutamate desuccinylase/aspartoacylase family protein [Thalassoroseus pseudoceratinae]
MVTEAWLELPVEVLHGPQDGPRVWLSAAVHGDELNGVEIIRQVLQKLDPKKLTGTVIATPIVNVFGFVSQSRYLPDRRDLNRSFPGTSKGSMAGRLANLFMTEIVRHCTHGIDLHTGSNHRTNLPQLRADLQQEATREFAEAFGAPVILDTHTRDGSLREAAHSLGIPVLVYEAGEPLRFDSEAISVGVKGILRALSSLGMITPPRKKAPVVQKFSRSKWTRAKRSGILRLEIQLGEEVVKKQRLGSIGDAFGAGESVVAANETGLIIGHVNNPLVHQGDAVVHIAY